MFAKNKEKVRMRRKAWRPLLLAVYTFMSYKKNHKPKK